MGQALSKQQQGQHPNPPRCCIWSLQGQPCACESPMHVPSTTARIALLLFLFRMLAMSQLLIDFHLHGNMTQQQVLAQSSKPLLYELSTCKACVRFFRACAGCRHVCCWTPFCQIMLAT